MNNRLSTPLPQSVPINHCIVSFLEITHGEGFSSISSPFPKKCSFQMHPSLPNTFQRNEIVIMRDKGIIERTKGVTSMPKLGSHGLVPMICGD